MILIFHILYTFNKICPMCCELYFEVLSSQGTLIKAVKSRCRGQFSDITLNTILTLTDETWRRSGFHAWY